MPPIVLVISAGDSGRGSSGPTNCVARYSTIRGGLDSQGGDLCICSCSVLRPAECVRHGPVRSRRPPPVLNDLLAFCPRPGFLRMHLGSVTDQLGLYIRRRHGFPAAGSGAHPRPRSSLHAGQPTRCRVTVEVLAPRFAQRTGGDSIQCVRFAPALGFQSHPVLRNTAKQAPAPALANQKSSKSLSSRTGQRPSPMGLVVTFIKHRCNGVVSVWS